MLQAGVLFNKGRLDPEVIETLGLSADSRERPDAADEVNTQRSRAPLWHATTLPNSSSRIFVVWRSPVPRQTTLKRTGENPVDRFAELPERIGQRGRLGRNQTTMRDRVPDLNDVVGRSENSATPPSSGCC